MTDYYIVTDVFNCITLCVPKAIFDKYFTADNGYCKHIWYYNTDYIADEDLEKKKDDFIATYRMDGKKSAISYGKLPSVINITDVYQWLS